MIAKLARASLLLFCLSCSEPRRDGTADASGDASTVSWRQWCADFCGGWPYEYDGELCSCKNPKVKREPSRSRP